MDDRQIPSGPGKTAPRLINDLLDYDPRYPLKGAGNILADSARQYKGQPIHRKDERACRHSLCRKDAQTNAPVSDDEQPDETTQYVVSAYCSRCRYHFKITVDLWQRKDDQVPCQLSDESNPLHHFRLVESIDGKEYKEKNGPNKYDLLTEAHRFVCTGAKCPAVIEIKVSPPRLSKSILASISDPAMVHLRGQREMKKEPERYAGQTPVTPAMAYGFLRQYLNDARRDTGEVKRIARRNKKYMLAFADECDVLFHYLDFVPVEEPSEAPEEEALYFWRLPTISDINRNFLDDVQFELDLLMAGRPQPEKQASNIRASSVQFIPALKDIERSLAYFGYPTRSRTVDLSTEEHPHYLSLGAVDNFTDALLEWAYDRQRQCDPINKPYYLDCLQGIATGRESADLQTRVVMATSAGEYGLTAIEAAYNFFRLELDTQEGDDHIMGLYKSRIESAPRQKEEARSCLLIIGKHRNSEKIEALANDKTMSHEEALEFLNVTAETASDSIEAAAVAISLDADKSRVARALQVIANNRGGDFTLSRAAAAMESGHSGFSLDIGEAYNRLQISNRNAPDETILAYYQSLSKGAPSGSKDSFTEALRVIALERQSAFLLRKLDDPNADVLASTAEPVGLDNIGNTCYLNSLLQYYYTIKPVRDMVIDFENHRMPLTEENIKNKRVGGRIVAKSEIVKAQKFVEELHNLFENLKTASSRSVKPTRELAELTIFSSLTEANFRRASISSPSGPPNIASIMDAPVYGPQWPPPKEASEASEASSATAEDDIEMIDRPDEKPTEAADDSSEATLVDMDQLPSYNELVGEKANQEAVSGEKNHSGVLQASEPLEVEDNTVMVNGETAADKADTVLTAPEKPPPIPPRNKSGLVISTNENKDLIPDDDLWRFGTQQDVTEVIGNVTFRMQCAIKPTSIEEGSGEQIDVIRDTFFGSSTTYTQKAQSLEKKVEAWPTIIVYPGKGVVRDIYEAIDVVFDEQRVEVDNTICPQYSCISKLPPVLQIQIQRTDYDKDSQRSSKNRTAVVFPETIYLDRYVDTGNPNSAIMKRRRETWKWKNQLRVLETRQEALKNTQAEINVPDALLATKDFVSALQEAEIEGIDIDPSLPEALEERISEVAAELEDISRQIATLKQSLQEQFTDMRENEYKLHSVFIHRGEAGGGHYWVYIYDFEHDIWREYNDEYVTEVKDRRRIFDQQGAAGGTPYYLVYVRSSDKRDLVDAVCRDVQPVQDIQMTDISEPDPTIINGTDFSVEDDQVRHIEHANPRPLRPKPPVSDAIEGTWEATWGFNQGKSGWEKTISELDANGNKW